jgi:hypothetical protein
VHDARADLAAAVRGPVLDDAALGAVLGRIDAAFGEVRSAALDALRGVHEVLDDRQRADVADLLEHRGVWWRRPGGRGARRDPGGHRGPGGPESPGGSGGPGVPL